MKIPKWIQEIMNRSKMDLDFLYEGCNPGYTLKIAKRTERTLITTFKKEMELLVIWSQRHYADAEILFIPSKTHYTKQYAVVVITDPVMQQLEKYIKL